MFINIKIYIFLFVLISSLLASDTLITIKPNTLLSNIKINPTEGVLFQAFAKDYIPNHNYKILVHYFGSVNKNI
jgi:hypothetical protein